MKHLIELKYELKTRESLRNKHVPSNTTYPRSNSMLKPEPAL